MSDLEVFQWLTSIGMDQYFDNFVQNGYDDIDALWDLNIDDLDSIGVKPLGHRKKILFNVSKLSNDSFSDWLSIDNRFQPENPSSSIYNTDEDLTTAIEGLEGIIGELSLTSSDSKFSKQTSYQHRSNINVNVNSHNLAEIRSSVYTADSLLNENVENSDLDLDDLLEDLYSFNPTNVLNDIKTIQNKELPSLVEKPKLNFSTSNQTDEMSKKPLESSAEQNQNVCKIHQTNLFSIPQTISINPNEILTRPRHLHPEEVQKRIDKLTLVLEQNKCISESQKSELLKQEKINIAIEKMRVASKQKIVIKAFNEDMSSKTVVVDDDMQSWYVCQMLMLKNHVIECNDWGLIEFNPNLGFQRMLEDHEIVVDVYLTWPRETQNMFIFKRDDMKYDLFFKPYDYFPSELCLSEEQAKNTKDPRTERARKMLINEYFNDPGRIPELEGSLFLKDGKKPWKKLFTLLRASGIYYSSRGKSKQSKNLVFFCGFDDSDLFLANNYKKLIGAPKNYCFVLRPNGRHRPIDWSDLKCFCVPNKQLMLSWISGIKLVKYGLQLKDNYMSMKNKEYQICQNVENNHCLDKNNSQFIKSNEFQTVQKDIDIVTNDNETFSQLKSRSLFPNDILQDTLPTNTSINNPLEVITDFQSYDESILLKPKPQIHYRMPLYIPAPDISDCSHLSDGNRTHLQFISSQKTTSPHIPDKQKSIGFISSVKDTSLSKINELLDKPWYHGAISREEANIRINNLHSRNDQGIFLIRESITYKGSFVLSMSYQDQIRNFQIQHSVNKRENVYRIDDGPSFASLEDLIKHYSLFDDRLPCKLSQLCPNNNFTNV